MADAAVGAGWAENFENLPVANAGNGEPGVRGAGKSEGKGNNPYGIGMKDYIDAQDDKTRAQNDARFAEVLAKLEIIQQTAASGRSVWGAALATIAAIAGLFVGVMAIEGDRFEGGKAARDTIATVIQPVIAAQNRRDAEQDRKPKHPRPSGFES